MLYFDDKDHADSGVDDEKQVRSQVDSGNSRVLGDYKGRFLQPEEVSISEIKCLAEHKVKAVSQGLIPPTRSL